MCQKDISSFGREPNKKYSLTSFRRSVYHYHSIDDGSNSRTKTIEKLTQQLWSIYNVISFWYENFGIIDAMRKSQKSKRKNKTNARRDIRKCHFNDLLECHSLQHKHHLISDAMCKCRAVSQIALIIIIVKQMQHLHTVWLLTPFNLHKIVISIYWGVLEMTENTSWFNYIAL